jgi:hypothetical protein
MGIFFFKKDNDIIKEGASQQVILKQITGVPVLSTVLHFNMVSRWVKDTSKN